MLVKCWRKSKPQDLWHIICLKICWQLKEKITKLEIARTGHGSLLIQQPKSWIITSSTWKTSIGHEVLSARCLRGVKAADIILLAFGVLYVRNCGITMEIFMKKIPVCSEAI